VPNLESERRILMMPIVTMSSLEQRTGPAWAKWTGANGVVQQQQFDSVTDAITRADKIYNEQHLTAWVEPATGPIYHPED
jgi:hypothetical protein